MRRLLLSLIIALGFGAFGTKPARAYDMDCAIMLCMAGGFPPSAVCSAAYTTMIWRITPYPALPPFGVCTYSAVPVELGGPGGEEALDVSTPEYEWLRTTRIYWFWGYSYQTRDGDRRWTWSINSCDRENRECRYFINVHGSEAPWPHSFTSESGQAIPYPVRSDFEFFYNRAIAIEYGDYEGVMDHSDWFHY